MSKITTTFSGSYQIQNANSMDSIASKDNKTQFNKLWIYPGKKVVNGLIVNNPNTGIIYIGERTDSGSVTPDPLNLADPPILIELPQGESKLLRDVLIQGANVGDGVWFKGWAA